MRLQISDTFWQGKRVFLTGHTGFKGSWLTIWLRSLGANVTGFSLNPPTEPSLFNEARASDGITSVIGDIRDPSAISQSVEEARPDILIHMAAQPLVRRSYQEPVETFATNVMGTIHVLEAARRIRTIRAIVNITTDKCYENREWVWGYRESEPMGGHDPYSSSKGCAELVTAAWRRSFFTTENVALASARAGNVIGGGDWAEDRLVPDILRAFSCKETVILRNPGATRPWQHVLEPLAGYLTLARALYEQGEAMSEPWNFGPNERDALSVLKLVEALGTMWGEGARWAAEADPSNLHEAHHLKLDISKAQARLGWKPHWDILTALEKTVDWHRAWLAGADMRSYCENQINDYMAMATS